MPETYTIPSVNAESAKENRKEAEDGTIYYISRGDLGYYKDEISRFIIQDHYKSALVFNTKHSRTVLFNYIVNKNPQFNTRNADYLDSSVTSIEIPTKDEFEANITRVQTNRKNVISLPSLKENKLAIVGHDSSPLLVGRAARKSFYEAAQKWEKNLGYKIYPDIGVFGLDGLEIFYDGMVNSGRLAIEVIEQYAQTTPITELFFSTHGTTYAIDFNQSSCNIYSSKEYVRIVTENNDWEPNADARFIEQIKALVSGSKLVEDIKITLGGCLSGATPQDVIDDGGNLRDNYRWGDFEKNAGREGKKAKNFAYLLSTALPKATIIASRRRVDSGIGIVKPSMYQNGICWHIPFNQTIGDRISGLEKSSLY